MDRLFSSTDSATPTTERALLAVRSIFEVIGRGEHSVVYKGRKKSTIIYYAIKSVEKQEKARVLQEVAG
jgi:hypothetical protein